jgi:methionyl-tRNA formyltransferase
VGRRSARDPHQPAPDVRHGALSGALRLVFAGTPATAVPSLEALLRSPHDVVAVVTRPDAPAGRGRRLAANPVADRARAEGLEVLTPVTPKDPEFQARLREVAPDCCPVVAYGALIPRSALDIPRLGWVNLHFSLLPAWRGAAPVQRALLAGDEVTGASTFLIEEGLDTGPVFGVVTEPIRDDDTTGSLLDRLAVSGAGLLVATMDGLAEGKLFGRPQPPDGISLAPKLTVDDAHVNWTAPALHIDRLVRAATPAPGAWTTFRGRRLKLGPVRRVAEPAATPAGPGRFAVAGSDVLDGTGSGTVRLGDVQPEGRGPMPADAWARGVRLIDEDALA